MNGRNVVAVALLAAALTATEVVACHADPVRPALHYTVRPSYDSVVVTLDRGSFAAAHHVRIVRDRVPSTLNARDIDADVRTDDTVDVKDQSGAAAVELPLSYRLNGVSYPIRPSISRDGRAVTLTPVIDRARAAAAPRVQPIASDAENLLAQQNFSSQLGSGTAVGGLVGTAIGAVIGFSVGTVVALASCAALLACLVAGLPIMAAFAGAGGAAGTILLGGATLVAAGFDYVQTLVSPPFSTHYEHQIDQTAQHTRH